MKKITLKTLFILLFVTLGFLILTAISYFMNSKPSEPFLKYMIDFVTFAAQFILSALLFGSVGYLLMHFSVKLYNKIFDK